MRLEEFCAKLHRSESTVLKNWKRTQEALERQGILVTRAGSGASAQYFIEYRPK